MARDEIAGRKKSPDPFHGSTSEKLTEERRRDRESTTGRAGGTSRILVWRDEEDEPRKTPRSDAARKILDEGGI